MLDAISHSAKLLLQQFLPVELPIRWVKRDESAWLCRTFPGPCVRVKRGGTVSRIEKLAQKTNSLGAQPIWNGYEGNNVGGSTRVPDNVRTAPAMGAFYSELVRKLKPGVIVEFGTAFGVSGMYFLAGLQANRKGRLLTFEPNETWGALARKNLEQISDRFTLTLGTFEENVDRVVAAGDKIELAFIDAIHTREFVIPQLDMVVKRSRDKAIIILDDLEFSDSMRECWREVSNDPRFSASAVLGRGVGLLELK